MSELKVFRFLGIDEIYPDANLGSDYYLKSEADKVIAELKVENERLRKMSSCKFSDDCLRVRQLKRELEDAGMRECRLRRALWIAHEYKAKYKRWWLHLALDCEAREIRPDKKTISRIRVKIGNCEKSERKCRAKAEQYR